MTTAQLIAWRVGDFRFGGTTIAIVATATMLVVGLVLAILWRLHRL